MIMSRPSASNRTGSFPLRALFRSFRSKCRLFLLMMLAQNLLPVELCTTTRFWICIHNSFDRCSMVSNDYRRGTNRISANLAHLYQGRRLACGVVDAAFLHPSLFRDQANSVTVMLLSTLMFICMSMYGLEWRLFIELSCSSCRGFVEYETERHVSNIAG